MSILGNIAKHLEKQGKVIGKEKVAASDAARMTDEIYKSLSGGERFFAKMMRYDENGIPNGFTWRAKGIMLGAAGLAAANNALNASTRANMGSHDGQIRTNTPDFQPYLKMKPQRNPFDTPGGADGSLVFALDKTKNGGFL